MAKITIYGHQNIRKKNGQFGCFMKTAQIYSLGKGGGQKSSQNPGMAKKESVILPLPRFLGRFDILHREPPQSNNST